MRSLGGLIVLVALTSLNAAADELCPCPPPPPPPPAWAGSLGAGLALTSGNSDTKSFNLSFGLVYDPKTKNLVKLEGAYLRSDTDGIATVNRTAARARDEYSLSKRAFAFGEVAYLRDEFKELSYQIAPIVGLGYKLVDQERIVFAVDGGVGGDFEKNVDQDSTSSGALKAGESVAWKIGPAATFTQGFTGLWRTDDFGDSTYHIGAGLASSVAKRLELKVAYAWDYKSRPPVLVKKGDNAFLAALVFKF
jgi:putative salt-induced outer membrane protein YdiY